MLTRSHRTAQLNTHRSTPLTKEYQPRLIRCPTSHDIRSQEPSPPPPPPPKKKREKNNKALGIDNLTHDVMILGGEKSVK